MTTTILSLPAISSQTCKPAIEGVVAAIAGVAAVQVDVPAKTVTIIHHDDRAPAGRLVEAIEDQGYHVAGAKVIGTSTAPMWRSNPPTLMSGRLDGVVVHDPAVAPNLAHHLAEFGLSVWLQQRAIQEHPESRRSALPPGSPSDPPAPTGTGSTRAQGVVAAGIVQAQRTTTNLTAD